MDIATLLKSQEKDNIILGISLIDESNWKLQNEGIEITYQGFYILITSVFHMAYITAPGTSSTFLNFCSLTADQYKQFKQKYLDYVHNHN